MADPSGLREIHVGHVLRLRQGFDRQTRTEHDSLRNAAPWQLQGRLQGERRRQESQAQNCHQDQGRQVNRLGPFTCLVYS